MEVSEFLVWISVQKYQYIVDNTQFKESVEETQSKWSILYVLLFFFIKRPDARIVTPYYTFRN